MGKKRSRSKSSDRKTSRHDSRASGSEFVGSEKARKIEKSLLKIKKRRDKKTLSDEELLRKVKKKLKKLSKREKKKKAKLSSREKRGNIKNSCEDKNYDVDISLMEKAKAMAPMTKEEWEKKQNVVKHVFDDETGRMRLVKGDGEILEECVSRERHLSINKQATKEDGEFFQKTLFRSVK